jgi:hypothetical protein
VSTRLNSPADDDLRQLIRDDRYWQSWHPDYATLRDTVTKGYRALYSSPNDGATGNAADGGGTVHVDAYQRHDARGNLVQVKGYERAAPDGGPHAAESDGRRVIYKNPDGSQEIREGGSRAWRGNNPGNLHYGPFAIVHGAIGRSGDFAIFPDEAAGDAALDSWLHDAKRRDSTLDDMIENEYAPPKENDTKAYQRFVRRRLGVPGNTQLKNLTPDQMTSLKRIIRAMEGWKPGTTRRSEKTTP